MNKLALIHKSNCYLTIYKLLEAFDSIDVVKLCLMTSAFSYINKKSFQTINDFFQVFADNLSCNSDRIIQIIEDIEFLKQNSIIKIEDNKVSLVVNATVNSFVLLPKETELLGQINKMKIDSLLRFIAQYV